MVSSITTNWRHRKYLGTAGFAPAPGTTRERAFQYVTGVSIPLFFLSNLSWPALASPAALVALATLLPTTAGINAIVRTQQMGARVPEVGGELLNLLLLALLYGALAAWRLRVPARPPA